MERQVKLNSDFILFSWIMALIVLVFGACTSDSDINPRIEAKADVNEFDYTILIEEEYHGEIFLIENSLEKN